MTHSLNVELKKTKASLTKKMLQAKAIRQERHDLPTCFTCDNFRGGTCAFRLGSPDYPTANVEHNDLACAEYNVPSTRIHTEPQAVFSGLPENVFYEGSKTTSKRIIMDMSVLSVDAMHRLDMVDEQYPCIAVTVKHLGETVVFYMPNTKEVRVGRHRIAANRYDVVSLFTKISESGKIDLTHWRRVQFDR